MAYKIAIAILLIACGANAIAQGLNGKIIFYRESHFVEYGYKPRLFCDGFELTQMMNGSYLEVVAKPGRHECVAETTDGAVTIIEVAPGGVAYWKVVITNTIKPHAAITASNQEEYGRQQKLRRIATAELDSVQPLMPVAPTVPIALAKPDGQESPAKNAEPEVVFHPDVDGVTHPMCMSCADPKYTPEARRAKINGTVEMSAIVGVDGKARSIQVVRALGHGLDERAVNAVQSWDFKPATGPDGNPVPVIVSLEITFRLLN